MALPFALPPPSARSPEGLHGYRRREPETTVLWQAVARHLDEFLEHAADRSQGHGVPSFVEKELRDFLTCGILAHGFLRVHCDSCGKDALVAFS